MDTTKNLAGRSILVNSLEKPPFLPSWSFWLRVFREEVADLKRLPQALAHAGWTWGGSLGDFFRAQTKLYGTDWCGLCQDREYHDNEYGHIYCLCALLKKRVQLLEVTQAYGSSWGPARLSDMQLITSTNSPSTAVPFLKEAIAYTREWIDFPDSWIVYSGGTGTGKTHMLSAIMNAWHPWAIYIVASDFEARLRTYLATDQDKIGTYITALMHHPMLVFDDLGLEHSTDWIVAKMDALIEHRSRKAHWWDHITACATNLPKSRIVDHYARNGVSRLGSRLTDTEIVRWMPLTGADYRNKPR